MKSSTKYKIVAINTHKSELYPSPASILSVVLTDCEVKSSKVFICEI